MAKSNKSAPTKDSHKLAEGEGVPGADKHPGEQTRGENEQDPKRREGNFTGAGEPARKQPGRRQ
jgi:hypothetical protein